jgi:AraC family transcriptional regulator, arabinose operon regulatory protein
LLPNIHFIAHIGADKKGGATAVQQKGTTLPSQHGISLFIPDDVIVRESRNSFLKNLIITKIGYYGNSYGHFIRRYNINEYVLLYCVDGKGWVETGGIRREVSKGDLVFCDINRPHAYGANNQDPWCIHWAHFTGAGVPEIYRHLGLSEQSVILPAGEKPELAALLQEAYKVLSGGYSFPNLLSAATCLQELFCHLVRERMNSGLQGSSGMDVESIIDMMVANIHENYSLEQLASHMKMSKFHFSRRFKQTTGYSPMEYFNRLKIQKACELLDTSSLDIKDISDYLSFSNPFYFSEVFKRIVGLAPRKYRNLQRIGHTDWNYPI